MTKKLVHLMAMLTIAALAVPAVALATELTMPVGETVENDTDLEWTDTGTKVKTSLGDLTCAKFNIGFTLTKNNGSEVTGVGSGGSATTCKLGTKEITITDITLNHLSSSTGSKGTVNLTFVADLPNSIVCHFSATSAPFTFTSGASTVTFKEADFTATPAACEPGLFSFAPTLETDELFESGTVDIDN